jgi:hypothetical protein
MLWHTIKYISRGKERLIRRRGVDACIQQYHYVEKYGGMTRDEEYLCGENTHVGDDTHPVGLNSTDFSVKKTLYMDFKNIEDILNIGFIFDEVDLAMAT